MTWARRRLDWLVAVERQTVDPAALDFDEVFHYSIPVLDELGDGQVERADEIGSGKLLLRGGEVLISKLNPRLPRVLRAEAHDVPTVASTEFIALRPGPEVDDRFLRYWLGSDPVRQLLDGATMSVTRSQQRVRPDILVKTWITLPARPQQRAIATFLDAETARLDALIAKKRRLISLLEERMWSSVAKEICEASGPMVPLRRMLTRITDGPFGSSLTSSHYVDEGPRVVRLGNIGFAEFKNEDAARIEWNHYSTLSCHRVSPGDLLIAGLGDSRNHVGRACVAPDLGPAIVKADCYCAGVDRTKALPEFLALFLSSPLGADEVALAARGTTRSRINLDIAKNISVPLLERDTQEQIVSVSKRRRLNALDGRGRLTKQIALLQEHRQALITAAVTGEFRVPDVAA